MLEDVTIESAISMEIVGSGDSGSIVVKIDTSVHKTNIHHMGGTSDHVHLYHNSSLYYFFNLIVSEEFRSGRLQ